MIRRAAPGFALILTLAAIVMLTVTLVAFLESVTIERRTASAYLNLAKADDVAQAGLETALLRLEEAIKRAKLTADDGTDRYRDFVVYERMSADPSLSPILVIGRNTGVYGEDVHLQHLTPLISTNSPHTAPAAFDSNAATAFSNLERSRSETGDSLNLNSRGTLLPSGSSHETTYYRTPAVELKDADGKVVGRYAFLIFDEQSRLNPYHHRADDRNGQDAWGKSSSELPFDIGTTAGGPILLSLAEQTRLTGLARLLMVTPYVAASAFDDRERFEKVQRFLTSGETHDEEVIPSGLPEAGLPKYNLNSLATDTQYGSSPTARSTFIANVIDRNFPHFKRRDPALASSSADMQKRYLKRLAASVVDYIDKNSDITHTEDGEPAGRDLFPLVVATAERYQQTTDSGQSRPIETQGFVQLWNPYTKVVTGKIRFKLYNRRQIAFGEGFATALQEYFPGEVSVTLQPNQMDVFEFPSVTQTFSSPTPVEEGPSWKSGPSDSEDGHTNEAFELHWRDQNPASLLIDSNRRPPVAPGSTYGGLARGEDTLNDTLNHWQFNFIRVQDDSNGVYRFAGDPRGSYLCAYQWSYANNWDKPLWRGRQESVEGRTQDYVTAWRNREPTRENPNLGSQMPSSTSIPTDAGTTYVPSSDGLNAPFYIKNAAMDSIGELGHIFDPAQADDSGFAPESSSGRFVSSGGRSLRIGYPEFEYWDKPEDLGGKRSIGLLDIFAIHPVESGYPKSRGTINLNTASEPVLRSLVAGISLNSDKGLVSSPAITPEGTAAIAQEIIKHRPFARLSDLAKILPVFNASPANFSPPLPPPDLMMDRTKEELFAKMIQSVSVRSHRFRVLVMGQTFNERNKPAAQSILEAVVTLSADGPEPDAPLRAKIRYLRHAN